MIGSKGTIFVLIGPPGSGKGSFSALCVQKCGWKQLSTGNLLRKHIEEQTEIGKQIDLVLKSGKLVSDDIIVDMVNQWLAIQIESGETILLDGYPRNLVQVQALHDFLKAQGFDLSKFNVVRFVVSDDVVVDRLSGRCTCKNKDCQAVYSTKSDSGLSPKVDMICDKCSSPLEIRNDDRPEVIKERLKNYRKFEGAILDFYKSNGQEIFEMDVSKSLLEVFEDFAKVMELED